MAAERGDKATGADGGAAGILVRRDGALAELTLQGGRRNPLTAPLRAALAEALAAAIADPEVRGIVLRGAGGNLSSGLDLAEIGHEAAPKVAELTGMIENSPKSVVAAVEGLAFGAGLELVLAAHWRVADPSARLALPEVSLGLVPSGGATQRLPRLIGAEAALRMLLAGAQVDAAEALAIGLIDRVVETGLAAAAGQMAVTAAPRPTGGVRIGMRDGPGYQQALVRARAAIGAAASEIAAEPGAAARAVDCVEAAQLLPWQQGLDYEAAAFAGLFARPEAAGLMRAHQAGVQAMALPGALSGQTARAPRRITVGGAGPAALVLVRQALARGIEVTLADPDRERLVAGLERIAEAQEIEVASGRLTAGARDAEWALLTPTLAAGALTTADLVLAGDEVALPEAAVHLGPLPAGGVGVALIPAPAPGRLAELALAGSPPDAVVGTTVALVRRLGWRHAVVGAGGPVAARLRRALAEAVAAEERAGHAPGEIAGALAGFGLGTPPAAGLPPAGPAGEAIIAHCLLAMANEGARMLGEGVVRRAAVVDAVAVGSGLFPATRGGPMFQAERRGILIVRAALAELAGREPALYTPAPLIDALLRDGGSFASLDI